METKVCTKCLEEKPLTSFYKNSKGKYNRSQRCRTCSRTISKKYREKHLDKVLASKFKTNIDTINKVLATCFCEICGDTKGRLVIDHCHTTGRIRGRLCSVCNTGIGHLRDDEELVYKAYLYLKESKDV